MNSKQDSTNRKRPFGKRLAMWAAPALAAATLVSGIAVANPAQASPTAPAVAATATPSKTNLQNADTGSRLHLLNETSERVSVTGGGDISPSGIGVRKGQSSDNDYSGKITFADKTTVDIHANNPLFSEAYAQVGPHKVYQEAYVKYNDKTVHVKYVGWKHYEGKNWKVWDFTILGSNAYYAHEFIHHLDKVDGTKGTVTNKTAKTATVRVGGADLELKPGQRMLYFDAGMHSGARGTQITVLRADKSKGAFTVEAVDPAATLPMATVVNGDGKKDHHFYSAKDAHTFAESGSDFKLTVTRQADHKLPCVYENWETNDWAVFDIDITAK